MQYKCFKDSPEPKFVTTIEDGYALAKGCNYYLGTTNRFNFNRYAVVAFYNPEDSGVNIYLHSGNIVNFSSTNIAVDVIGCDGPIEGLNQSTHIIHKNLGCCYRCKPKFQLLFKSDSEKRIQSKLEPRFTLAYNYIISPFSSININFLGSAVLTPGTARIYWFNNISPNTTATASVGIEWWEEKINPFDC